MMNHTQYPCRVSTIGRGKGTCKVWVGDVFIGYMVHGIWDGSPTPSTSASCMVWETMFLGMRDRGYGGPLSISEIFIPKNIDTVRHTYL